MPLRPQGLAQSNTGRCASAICGAPSSVMAPHTCSLAASTSFLEKPRWLNRSKPGSFSVSASIFSGAGEEILADGPAIEGKLDVEGGLERGVQLAQNLAVEAAGL